MIIDTIQCPIGIDANDPHTFIAGTGRLAFYDIMGVAGHIHEVCQECAHPMNEPVVDGGLELAPNLDIYTVMVGDTRLNIQPISMSQAMSLAHLYSDYDDVVIDISQDSSQGSYSYSEMAELTHTTQVAMFGWCSCEDNAGHENPYPNCPK
jgi:hypothetical protein